MPYPHMVYPNGVPHFILDGFTDPGVVLVSGGGVNGYGHALLKLSNTISGYVHVDEPYNYPKFLSTDNFEAYLRIEGKTVWGEVNVRVPDLDRAKRRLDEVARAKWLWLGVADNCADFAVRILNEGGAGLPGNLSNMPLVALQQAIQGVIPGWRPVVGPQTINGARETDDFFRL